MWLIPLGLSIRYFYIRFIIIWIIFTLLTAYVTYRATRQPIERNTPRYFEIDSPLEKTSPSNFDYLID